MNIAPYRNVQTDKSPTSNSRKRRYNKAKKRTVLAMTAS